MVEDDVVDHGVECSNLVGLQRNLYRCRFIWSSSIVIGVLLHLVEERILGVKVHWISAQEFSDKSAFK